MKPGHGWKRESAGKGERKRQFKTVPPPTPASSSIDCCPTPPILHQTGIGQYLQAVTVACSVGARHVCSPRSDGDVCDMADTSQGFTTKSVRTDAAEVVKGLEFASCESFAHNFKVIPLQKRKGKHRKKKEVVHSHLSHIWEGNDATRVLTIHRMSTATHESIYFHKRDHRSLVFLQRQTQCTHHHLYLVLDRVLFLGKYSYRDPDAIILYLEQLETAAFGHD